MSASASTSPVAGTPFYLPPEVMRDMEKSGTTRAWDVWSFGILACRVFAPQQANLFPVMTWNARQMAADGGLGLCARAWARSITDEQVRKLTLWCLQESASLQPTMRGVCLHLRGLLEVENIPSDVEEEKIATMTVTDEEAQWAVRHEDSTVGVQVKFENELKYKLRVSTMKGDGAEKTVKVLDYKERFRTVACDTGMDVSKGRVRAVCGDGVSVVGHGDDICEQLACDVHFPGYVQMDRVEWR